MASIKAIPNLPASSRMQMPAGSDATSSIIKEFGGMKKGKAASAIKSGGIASKITGTAKGKTGMKGSNPYC